MHQNHDKTFVLCCTSQGLITVEDDIVSKIRLDRDDGIRLKSFDFSKEEYIYNFKNSVENVEKEINLLMKDVKEISHNHYKKKLSNTQKYSKIKLDTNTYNRIEYIFLKTNVYVTMT